VVGFKKVVETFGNKVDGISTTRVEVPNMTKKIYTIMIELLGRTLPYRIPINPKVASSTMGCEWKSNFLLRSARGRSTLPNPRI
jgi:hypothetical protein